MFGIMLLVCCFDSPPQYTVVSKMPQSAFTVVDKTSTTTTIVTSTISSIQTYNLPITQSGGCVGGACYVPPRQVLFPRLRR